MADGCGRAGVRPHRFGCSTAGRGSLPPRTRAVKTADGLLVLHVPPAPIPIVRELQTLFNHKRLTGATLSTKIC